MTERANIRRLEMLEEKTDQPMFDPEKDIDEKDWAGYIEVAKAYRRTSDWGFFLGLASEMKMARPSTDWQLSADDEQKLLKYVDREQKEAVEKRHDGAKAVRLAAEFRRIAPAARIEIAEPVWRSIQLAERIAYHEKRWHDWLIIAFNICTVNPSRVQFRLDAEMWNGISAFFTEFRDDQRVPEEWGMTVKLYAATMRVLSEGKYPLLTPEDRKEMIKAFVRGGRKMKDAVFLNILGAEEIVWKKDGYELRNRSSSRQETANRRGRPETLDIAN